MEKKPDYEADRYRLMFEKEALKLITLKVHVIDFVQELKDAGLMEYADKLDAIVRGK